MDALIDRTFRTWHFGGELAKLQIVARDLVRAVEELEGVPIPYPTACRLAVSCDAVRVMLGDDSKLK